MSSNKYKFTLNTAEMNDSHMGLAVRIKPKQRILELGCSSGYLSKYLKEDLGCSIVGVDIDSQSAKEAQPFCDKIIVADLDDDAWLKKIKGHLFDVVLCADVLEHLKHPVELLKSLKPFLHGDSLLLASVPNVAHASIRLELLQGHFDYESLGLLDNTHLHFYTRDGLVLMLMQAGYVCCDISYTTHDLADEAIDMHLEHVGLVASDVTRQLLHAPDAKAFQFIIEARPAKAEILEHLPQALSPKPLVSSGLNYAEKQVIIDNLEKKIGALEQNIEGLELHVIDLEKNVVFIEEQRGQEAEHNKNHQKNISKLEEALSNSQKQNENEQEHNKNHLKNITKLEEAFSNIQKQNKNEQEHNKNHLKAIQAWQDTSSLLDNALFDLTENVNDETDKNSQLAADILGLQAHVVSLKEQNQHYFSDVLRLEGVLARVHSKVSYRGIRWVKSTPKKVASGLQKLIKKKGSGTFIESKEKAEIAIDVHDYPKWLKAYENNTKKQLELLKLELSSWKVMPKIAVIMPVYNPEKEGLENAIESVLQQTYENLELCIADDASTESYVKEVLSHYADKDSRVKLVFREKNGHISEASNSALALVEADYVALMDHDDLITPDALFWVAKTIYKNPDVELIYSDEDKMDLQGNRYCPYFKPDWNPELLLSHNFISHLGVYKTEKITALGGFDSAFDGAQDYDLVLRYVETLTAEKIIHIPRILYHWRAVEGSTANGIYEKPYAEKLIANAVENALQRQNRPAEITAHQQLPGALRVRYSMPENLPLVSIVIPSRNGFSLLKRCVESILEKTGYENFEIIIIDNGSDDLVAVRYLQKLQENTRITVIRDESPFNYAALNNKAVAQVKGEIIALLNNDLEVINDDWLDEMVGHAIHPEVGAVGAKLYYPDDTIQHAGVIVGLGGVAGHSHKHFPRDHPGYCGRLLLTQNLSAVTAACLVVRKSVFDGVGGFDETNLAVAFNDVDLCLRIKEQGFYNIWTPYAEMYHYESATRGYEDTPEKQARFNAEVGYMKKRWGDGLLIDPAYNPNLTLDREDFSFSWPPRI